MVNPARVGATDRIPSSSGATRANSPACLEPPLRASPAGEGRYIVATYDGSR